MKKIVVVAVFLFVGVLSVTFGQTININVGRYNSLFTDNRLKNNGGVSIAPRYYNGTTMCENHFEVISALEGDTTDIDTQTEWFFTSYACEGVINARPV